MNRKMFRTLIIVSICICFATVVSAETLQTSTLTIEQRTRELFIAIEAGSKKASRLINSGVDLETKNRSGMTPFLLAVRAGNLSIIRKLMSAGCDVSVLDNEGNNALLLAAKNGSHALVKYVLAIGGYDVNSRNSAGETPLMIAAGGGGYQLLHILLDAKANAHLADNKGRSMLMLAASSGNLSLVKSLVEQGSGDINAVDSMGRPVISYAMSNGDVSSYLVDRGVNLQVNYLAENGFQTITPLLDAVLNSNWQAIRSILQKGVDINQTAEFGVTPVLAASLTRQWELMEYLMENGARPDVQLSGIPAHKGADYNGSHPILMAALDNQEELVCRLASEYKNFANTPSSTGMTPLTVAVARELPDMEACLRKTGATLNDEQQDQSRTMQVSESRDAAVSFLKSMVSSLRSFLSDEHTYPVDGNKFLSDRELYIPEGVQVDYIPVCMGAICNDYRMQVISETGNAEFSIDGKSERITWRVRK